MDAMLILLAINTVLGMFALLKIIDVTRIPFVGFRSSSRKVLSLLF